MNLDQLTIQLFLVLLPGVLCAYIVDTFTRQPRASQFQFIVNSIVYGVASYLVYALGAYWLPAANVSDLNFIRLLSGAEVDNAIVLEIVSVCGIAVVLGWISVASFTHRFHYRVLRWLNITKKYGSEDVWAFLFNSPDTKWVCVRDMPNNLMYEGSVLAFSGNSHHAELLLENARVYENASGNHLYDVKAQYLSLEKGNISIEVIDPTRLSITGDAA